MASARPASKTVGIAYIMHWTGRSQETVYRWIRVGYLPTPADTRPTIWPREQIDQWLNQNFEFH